MSGDPASCMTLPYAKPLYLRIRKKIAELILDGVYQDGDALPSVRRLASDFGANPLTVGKAYQTFLNDGISERRPGLGTFVVPGGAAKLKISETERFVQEEWPRIAAQMVRLGIRKTDLFKEEEPINLDP